VVIGHTLKFTQSLNTLIKQNYAEFSDFQKKVGSDSCLLFDLHQIPFLVQDPRY
jgi:hypothetical protein